MRSVAGSEIPLRSYEALRGDGEVNDLLLTRVLYGISCRNYEAAAETIPGASGYRGRPCPVASSRPARRLREFQERDLSSEDVLAVVLDGKTFADAVMVIAVGITISGEKRFLGFVETDTENEPADAVPVVGRAGPRPRPGRASDPRRRQGAAVGREESLPPPRLGPTVPVAQRERGEVPGQERAAGVASAPPARYNRPAYDEAVGALEKLQGELDDRNQCGRQPGGRPGRNLDVASPRAYGVLGRSLKTTNGLVSVNALVEERVRGRPLQNSSQRHPGWPPRSWTSNHGCGR